MAQESTNFINRCDLCEDISLELLYYLTTILIKEKKRQKQEKKKTAEKNWWIVVFTVCMCETHTVSAFFCIDSGKISWFGKKKWTTSKTRHDKSKIVNKQIRDQKTNKHWKLA